MTHMQMLPPNAPTINSSRRPAWSIRYSCHTKVRTVLTTPKIPVVKKLVSVLRIPMLLNTVGL